MPAAADTKPAAPLEWGDGSELNALEAVMWRAEIDPRLRSTIVAFELLDRAPEWQRFYDAHEWATRMVPRFRKRVEDVGFGAPRWVLDERFDVDLHVGRLALPDGATLQDALKEAARIAMAPFDRSRPPWEAVLIEGLPEGRAAYLLKLHHASTDGIGAIQLLRSLHSPTRRPRPDKPQPPPPAGKPETVSALDGLRRQTAGDLRGLAGLVGGAARGAMHPGRLARDTAAAVASLRRVLGDSGAPPSPLLAERSGEWSFIAHEVGFEELKAAGRAAGGTLNDAFLAALLGGLGRYHAELGVSVEALPMAIPISVRKPGAPAGGNAFAAAKLAGPLAIADPIERMQAIGRQVRAARSEPALDALRHVTPLLARLPGPVLARVAAPLTVGNDVQATNVPGIRDDVYLAGAKVERLYPFPPLPGCAAMFALVTHGDVCCIGANVDAGAFADVPRFARCLVEGFEEVVGVG